MGATNGTDRARISDTVSLSVSRYCAREKHKTLRGSLEWGSTHRRLSCGSGPTLQVETTVIALASFLSLRRTGVVDIIAESVANALVNDAW